LNGSEVGPAGIKAEQLNDDVWNYIFLNKNYPKYPKKCGIKRKVLDEMKNEFEFWYPLDLRVSGKDLIGNHLTMSLYNHAAIWNDQPEKWPRAFYTNGHLMINAEKMSKSTGNFMTLKQAMEKYGTDATRLALADSGDTLMDANFAEQTADKCILNLTKEKAWIEEHLATPELLEARTGKEMVFTDKVFQNEIYRAIDTADKAYSSMRFHDVVVAAYFELFNARDQYRAACSLPFNKSLFHQYVEAFIVVLSPIIPHWTQDIWEVLGHKGLIADAKWPKTEPEDTLLTEKTNYLRSATNSFRSQLLKQRAKMAKAKNTTPITKASINVATSFPDYQQATLEFLKNSFDKNGSVPATRDLAKELSKLPHFEGKANKKILKRAMAFGAKIVKEFETRGKAALQVAMPFDEIALLNEQNEIVSRGMEDIKISVVQQSAENSTKAGAAVPGQPKVIFS
jgi:leucyl-tRNA synthetase